MAFGLHPFEKHRGNVVKFLLKTNNLESQVSLDSKIGECRCIRLKNVKPPKRQSSAYHTHTSASWMNGMYYWREVPNSRQ